MLPEEWKVEIQRSRRKTLSICAKEDYRILVKAPYRMPEREICEFLEEKKGWLEKHFDLIEKTRRETEAEGYLTAEEIRTLALMAKRVLPGRVDHYASVLGVDYGRITIRNQKSCWGSCSAKGNLNFNCLLMLAPSAVADYVVVHELCHRLEMNHSAAFWKLVEKVLPDYRERRKWLKENGEVLLRRMTG